MSDDINSQIFTVCSCGHLAHFPCSFELIIYITSHPKIEDDITSCLERSLGLSFYAKPKSGRLGMILSMKEDSVYE